MTTFSEYQERALTTAVYPNIGDNLNYPALGLGGETGEVLEHIKKIERDDNGEISSERQQALKKEMGDVLWYLACLSHEVGIDLEEAAQANLDKLESRAERGKIHGSGDDR